MTSETRVGFMQGRLSPLVDDRIQAFPGACWREEFPVAQSIGFRLMEWTLDQATLYSNPLLIPEGRAEIRALSQRHGVAVPSVTGDCFMQAPLWKALPGQRSGLERDFQAVATACAAAGIATIVVPLVDNGRLEHADHQAVLLSFMQSQEEMLARRGLRVVFESDFAPPALARFIEPYDAARFGINYDTGNSASRGYDCSEEFAVYGKRVANVHIKDSALGGGTVPLGAGVADFDKVFSGLAEIGYAGNFVLQTARASDSDHAGALTRYRAMLVTWLKRHDL